MPRLRRVVRQVASELNKKVHFEVGNADGEMDRNVLERMVAPLEHMLRNAVDHGLESTENVSLQANRNRVAQPRADVRRRRHGDRAER
ncbi:hypothetical protein F2S71_04875 [Pseudomonas syringae pv. actinidiae]|nr:hypothetical protein [Pseudomonas syringae pv. actinidiae]